VLPLQCCPCTLFSSARCTPSPDKEVGRAPGLWALLHDAATARLEAIEEILQLATLEVKLNPETVRVDLLWVPATQRSGAAARRAATF
jgi:hypothetical protein